MDFPWFPTSTFLLLFLLLLCTDFRWELLCDARRPRITYEVDDKNAVSRPENAGFCAAVVAPHGYKCEEFEVKTGDGYILTMQRIPEGRIGGGGGGGGQKKQPVLLQHGVLMDGLTWVLNCPEESLAFILADHGYDVWIANTRGTRWSRRHASLNPSTPAYWAWSWDELVAYDLPTTVNFVHQRTGQNLHYVGHSLGTLIALSSFSERKLVDKLSSAALLSPVAYLTHMSTPLGVLAAKSFVGEVIIWLGIAEFNPKGSFVANFLEGLCRVPAISCYDLMSTVTGSNCCLNSSTLELFLKFEPQPTSTRTLVHLAQTFRDGVLKKYDYQSKQSNIANYGQSQPPAYNMSNIPHDLPLFLSYGGKDSLSDVKDVLRLLDELKGHDVDKLTVQFVEDYAHADFVLGVTAKKIVYDQMLAFFNSH